jgi:hypothetical protein
VRRSGAAALVSGLLLLAAPAGAPAATTSCSSKGSTTVRENSVVRLYDEDDISLFSCSKRTGHREFLHAYDAGRVWQLRLRGHYVAYAYESCLDAAGEEDCLLGIEVNDARTGRRTFSEMNAYGADRLVLKRNGSIAWGIEYGDTGGDIFKRDCDGRKRLARGKGVDPRSLRLRGSTLSWTSGGERRTAPLR